MPKRNWPGNSTVNGGYRFGFNGKEKDDEITGTTGSHLDFGARIYDSRICRWLAVDPYQKKYPYLSGYASFENNPISIVDPGGDTTLYYSQKGQLLFTSYDKLPAAITIVSDKNIKQFTIQVASLKAANVQNDNKANIFLRKEGKTFDVNSLRTFYNRNTVPGKDNKVDGEGPDLYAPNYFNESSGNLYQKDGLIKPGAKAEPGSLATVTSWPDIEPDKGEKVGKIHLHPNEGLAGPPFRKPFSYGPSTNVDVINGGNMNVIVGRENIYIYGKDAYTISVNKKTLQSGKLDPAVNR
ncbi:MAG: hypothetical protein HY951_02440 [Bacteroidia bacterium]|nr:hypothetical protein [Bacteroidia bacterium]